LNADGGTQASPEPIENPRELEFAKVTLVFSRRLTGRSLKREEMIQAILFDSDGVLVDTERLFFEATREAFAIDGAVISPDQWAI